MRLAIARVALCAAAGPLLAASDHPAYPVESRGAVVTSTRVTSTGAAAARGPGDTKVNQFVSYNAGTKTVSIALNAALNSAQGGFNFNGGSSGNQTITVPVGWQVNVDFHNNDAIPHSGIFITNQTPVPASPSTPAFPRAYTDHLIDGLPAQTGHDTMNFTATPAGNYLIACGVPGHAPSGMYIVFVVSATAKTPTNTGTIATGQ